MGSKAEKSTKTLEHALLTLAEDLENLRESVEEAAEGMEERFPGAERTELWTYAAGELGSIEIENLEMPIAMANVPVRYEQDTRKGQPKRTELANMVALLTACYEAADCALGDTPSDEEEEFVHGLMTAKDIGEGIDLG